MVDAGIDVALLSPWFSVDKDLKHDKEMALALKNEGMTVQVIIKDNSYLNIEILCHDGVLRTSYVRTYVRTHITWFQVRLILILHAPLTQDCVDAGLSLTSAKVSG